MARERHTHTQKYREIGMARESKKETVMAIERETETEKEYRREQIDRLFKRD